MRAWMVWLIILGLLLAVAALKVGLHIVYRNDAFGLKLLIWKLKFSLIDEKEAKKEDDAVSAKQRSGRKTKRNMKPWIRAVIDNRYDIFGMIGRLLSSPTLDILHLEIDVGGGEPDQCALKYGRVCGAVGVLLAPIENTFKVKERCINVRCCFDKADMEIDAEAAMTLRVYEAVAIAVAALKLGYGLYQQGKSNMKVV